MRWRKPSQVRLRGYTLSGLSDRDVLAILNPAADVNALPRVHRIVSAAHPNVDCDGIYLTPGELALPPAGKGPSAREGKVVLASGDERHAVTWLTLLRHGITVKGRLPSSEWLSADETQAAFYSRQNLISYWLPWLDQRRSWTEFDNWAVAWGCLGIARLHAAMVRMKCCPSRQPDIMPWSLSRSTSR
jgi:hypothetical protein